MKCPYCGKESDFRDSRCHNCGGIIIKIKPRSICPECGSEVPDSARFCPGCGKRVLRFNKEEQSLRENDFHKDNSSTDTSDFDGSVKKMNEDFIPGMEVKVYDLSGFMKWLPLIVLILFEIIYIYSSFSQ